MHIAPRYPLSARGSEGTGSSAAALALSLSGLFAASLLVSGLEFGWIPASERDLVSIFLLVAVVPLQATAAVAGVASGQAPSALAAALLAASWAGTAVSLPHAGSQLPAALGLLLGANACLLAIDSLVILRSHGRALGILFAMAALRFAFTAVWAFSATSAWELASAWTGLAVGVGALYAVAATVLPGRR